MRSILFMSVKDYERKTKIINAILLEAKTLIIGVNKRDLYDLSFYQLKKFYNNLDSFKEVL